MGTESEPYQASQIAEPSDSCDGKGVSGCVRVDVYACMYAVLLTACAVRLQRDTD